MEPFNDWPNDQGFDVFHEEQSPVELVISGDLPNYVAGTLYRTGPGGRNLDTDQGSNFSVEHWFDGFSQVHRFQLILSDDGRTCDRVLYNSRHLCDGVLQNIRKTGSFKDFSFGQKRDPCEELFKKVKSTFTPSTLNANTSENVGVTLTLNSPAMAGAIPKDRQEFGGDANGITSLFTKTDSTTFQQIDSETLEPLGIARQESLHPDLKGRFSAAHARSDPETGDMYNYNLEIGEQTVYRVFCTSTSTGETTVLATIDDASPAYLHSFMLTEGHVVLCVWNSQYAKGGMKLLEERNILHSIGDFDSLRKPCWYVIDRRHGNGIVATYDSDPFFCFHTVNAWEEPSETTPGGTDIVADLVIYRSLDVLHRLYYENLRSTSEGSRNYCGRNNGSSHPFLVRYRAPTFDCAQNGGSDTRKVSVVWAASLEASGELPTINPKYATTASRYIYAVTDRGFASFYDGLVKYDTYSHTPIFWSEKGQNPGEAIFVPDPDGTKEDDGVLLSVVLDGFSGKSYLICLDSKTMTECGRASLQTVVAFGFHGTHFFHGRIGPSQES